MLVAEAAVVFRVQFERQDMGRKPGKKKSIQKKSSSGRAVPSGRSAVEGEPPELRVAEALFRRGDYDDALRQFGHAARLYPQNISVLIVAARAYGRRYQLDRSDRYLQRAAQFAPRRPDVQHLIGETYRMLGMLIPAQRAFEQVCSLVDDGSDAQLQLAFIYERRNQLDVAYQLLNRFLRVHPGWFRRACWQAALHGARTGWTKLKRG
jgi:tetratricopeptide (TPR) repeat protein